MYKPYGAYTGYTVAIRKRIEAHDAARQLIGSPSTQNTIAHFRDGIRPSPVAGHDADEYTIANQTDAYRLTEPDIPTYYMSREIIRVIEDAADGIPDNFSLLPDDTPTPAGFMYLDGGIEQPDWLPDENWPRTDQPLPGWVAFAWNHRTDESNRGGLHVLDFNSVSGVDGTPVVIDALHWPWGTGLADKAQQSAEIQVYGPEATAIGYQEGDRVSPEDAKLMWVMFDRLLRLYATMFVFMRQKILVSTPRRPDRAERRRAARHGVVLDDIQVIRLRGREAAVAESEATHSVDWARRWIVRGHWRNQWYPSLKMHQPKWIGPYIKGPDGKPLIEPQKLFAVVD